MGDIVVFGRDDRRVSGGAGAFVPGAGAAVGGYKAEGKAVVVLDYRIVDVETSEVVASGEARGESKRTSKGAGAAFFAGGVFGGGASTWPVRISLRRSLARPLWMQSTSWPPISATSI